jgi:hypothetical protein
MQMTDVIPPDAAKQAKQVFLAVAQISALIAGPLPDEKPGAAPETVLDFTTWFADFFAGDWATAFEQCETVLGIRVPRKCFWAPRNILYR